MARASVPVVAGLLAPETSTLPKISSMHANFAGERLGLIVYAIKHVLCAQLAMQSTLSMLMVHFNKTLISAPDFCHI